MHRFLIKPVRWIFERRGTDSFSKIILVPFSRCMDGGKWNEVVEVSHFFSNNGETGDGTIPRQRSRPRSVRVVHACTYRIIACQCERVNGTV